MDDRSEQDQVSELHDDIVVVEPGIISPPNELEFFGKLRDVIHTEYLWQWDITADETKQVIKTISHNIKTSGGFRLVGEVELQEHVFDMALWLQDSTTFSISDIDVLLLESLALDLGRGTIFIRELTQQGLIYHVLVFGEARARELQINIIGPRMQQIRDLGTLVVTAMDSFSA